MKLDELRKRLQQGETAENDQNSSILKLDPPLEVASVVYTVRCAGCGADYRVNNPELGRDRCPKCSECLCCGRSGYEHKGLTLSEHPGHGLTCLTCHNECYDVLMGEYTVPCKVRSGEA